MEFTYNGMVRYGFGFDNPNHAAALITMLLPILWTIRLESNKPFIKYPVLLLECTLYAALFYTYSRAGLLALAVSALFFASSRHLFIQKQRFSLPKRKTCYIYGVSLLGLIGIMIYSGFATRIIKSFVAPDKAMTNRFDVWSGGLHMLRNMPQGTGTGLSGKIYTLFYLPPESYLAYRTMVNSFVTYAVEQGIVVSLITFFILAAISGAGLWLLNKDIKHKNILICAMAVIVSGAISAMLSTCFDISLSFDTLNNNLQYLLLIMWLSCFAALLPYISKNRKQVNSLIKPFPMGFASFTGAVLILTISGCYVFSPSLKTAQISLLDKGIIKVEERKSPSCNLMLLDFNRDNQKEQIYSIRKQFPDSSFIVDIQNTTEDFKRVQKGHPITKIIIYGSANYSKLKTFITCNKAILFNPPIPAKINISEDQISKVYLSRYDERGSNFLWEQILPKSGILYF